jgi:hypothetical protein
LGVDPAPPLLRSLAIASLARGDFAAARDFGTQLRARGERDRDDVLRVESEYVLGVCAFWAAELADARTHFESVASTYRDENRQEHLLRYGQDPKVICLARLACTYWFLGEHEAAIRTRGEGLALAEQIGHPYSYTTALMFATLLALDTGDVSALRGYLGRAMTVLPEEAGPQTTSALNALNAYLDVLEGHRQEGIARIQEILSDPRLAQQSAPGLQSCLARILLAACDAAADARTGLAAAEQLLAMTNSRVWRPEAVRLRRKFLATLETANA